MRWALNLLHRAGLADRVYGPDADPAGAAPRCADEGLPVYLYGSTEETLDRLIAGAGADVPGAEDRRDGAVEVPRRPARRGRRDRRPDHGLRAPGSCWSGSAARARRSSRTRCARCWTCRCWRSARPSTTTPGCCASRPPWMQRARPGVVLALRLEPKRLWRRYVMLNPAYLTRLAAQKTGLWQASPPAPATEAGHLRGLTRSRTDEAPPVFRRGLGRGRPVRGSGPGVDVAGVGPVDVPHPQPARCRWRPRWTG